MSLNGNSASAPPRRLRFGAALLALSVLLQMSYVPVSYAVCDTKGTKRIAFGEISACAADEAVKACCSAGDQSSAPDGPALSQKCCDTDFFEAAFFSFKENDGDQRFRDLTPLPALTLHVDFAERPLNLRHVRQHLKIPPSPGQTLLKRDCRLNV